MMVSIDLILKICAGFTCICVAAGWLIKIIKGVKKPADDVKEKLDNDNKRIKRLEDDIDYIKKTQTQLLQVCLVILDELKKNNDVDGIIEKTEDNMRKFLIER
jgi:uncharacterized protein YoxC